MPTASDPSNSAAPMRRRGLLAAAALLFVVGTWLRVHGAATLSIDADEIYSVWETRSARKTANELDLVDAWKTRLQLMVQRQPADPPNLTAGELWRLRWAYRTNPLYLLMNELAYELFGDTPLSIRVVSLLFGLAAMVVLPWLARPLVGDRGALLLLALLALCPEHVQLSHLGRYQSVCFFFGGVAALAAARFARDRRRADELLCLLACAGLVATHLTGVLVAATLFLYLAVFARGPISRWVLPLLACAGVLVLWKGGHGKVFDVIHDKKIAFKSIYPWWRLAISLLYNVGPAIVALGVVAVFGLARFGPRTIVPLVAAALVPIPALFWMNHWNDVGPRYFGAVEGVGVVLAAFGAEWFFRAERWRRLAPTIVGVALLTMVPLLASNWVDGQRYPWNDAARVLHERSAPRDRLVSDSSGIVDYYLDADFHETRRAVTARNLPKLEELLLEGGPSRAFLVLPRQRSSFAWGGDPAKLEAWLAAHAKPIARLGRERFDARLYRFELDVEEVDLDALRTWKKEHPDEARGASGSDGPNSGSLPTSAAGR